MPDKPEPRKPMPPEPPLPGRPPAPPPPADPDAPDPPEEEEDGVVETVVANVTGKTRRAKLGGREHVVVPMSLIVPGVLNGSQGPLLYEAAEIARYPAAWNAMPLVVDHPTHEGQPISARDPDVLERVGIGHVFRAQANGKLTAEGWFDVAATRKVDGRILAALEAGKSIELSTGLYVDQEPAPADAVHNGRPYQYVARNMQADHLAVLAGDAVGACSLADGCGVNVNALTTNGNPPMSTTPAPAANCATTLFPEATPTLAAAAAPTLPPPAPTTPAAHRPQTADEWFASAPPEIQAAVRNAMALEQEQRAGLLDQLTADAADDLKAGVREAYAVLPTERLQVLARARPTRSVAPGLPALNYLGAAGTAPAPAHAEPALPDPVYDFSHRLKVG